MTARKPLSKKIRFEVFKRDKFQCQYCGRKSPEVILNVDHIDPVANGGANDIFNLITSCFECNQGKKARLLSDDTVIQKQRKQIELIQERKEQLELMLEWKKTLTDFDNEKVKMVSEYWASIMKPYILSEKGLKTLESLINKFPIEDILDAIDIANKKYLIVDKEGNVSKESVEEAFNKVGGICAIKNMPILKQKLSYIKGICRNRFSYWDDKKGSIILNNYVNALKDADWSEESIIEDLENEVIPRTIESKNWSQWRNIIEQWTDDIYNWKNSKESNSEKEIEELSFETLQNFSNAIISENSDRIEVLEYYGNAFPNFDFENFRKAIYKDCQSILRSNEILDDYLNEFTTKSESFSYFELTEPFPDNLGFLMILESAAFQCLSNIFESLNINHSISYNEKDKNILIMLLKENLK